MRAVLLSIALATRAFAFEMPEIYQDVWIRGECTQKGVRACTERYEAIRGVLAKLPKGFKVLDIGASQGYFSFRMAEEFGARPVMIEDGYICTDQVWETGRFLTHLCKQNGHIPNLVHLKTRVSPADLKQLASMEQFDLVIAMSILHHMRNTPSDSFTNFDVAVDAILDLAPNVIVENPINTGDHTRYVRQRLIARGGKVIHTEMRGTLIYEIYLFTSPSNQPLPNISYETYEQFHGSYSSVNFD